MAQVRTQGYCGGHSSEVWQLYMCRSTCCLHAAQRPGLVPTCHLFDLGAGSTHFVRILCWSGAGCSVAGCSVDKSTACFMKMINVLRCTVLLMCCCCM